jgi:hypothetical protein
LLSVHRGTENENHAASRNTLKLPLGEAGRDIHGPLHLTVLGRNGRMGKGVTFLSPGSENAPHTPTTLSTIGTV